MRNSQNKLTYLLVFITIGLLVILNMESLLEDEDTHYSSHTEFVPTKLDDLQPSPDSVQAKSRNYLVTADELDYEGAAESCKRAGMELVYIYSSGKHEEVKKHIMDHAEVLYEEFWVNGRYSSGKWHHVNGEILLYGDFYDGHPEIQGDMCMVAMTAKASPSMRYKMRADNCGAVKRYVCENPIHIVGGDAKWAIAIVHLAAKWDIHNHLLSARCR